MCPSLVSPASVDQRPDSHPLNLPLLHPDSHSTSPAHSSSWQLQQPSSPLYPINTMQSHQISELPPLALCIHSCPRLQTCLYPPPTVSTPCSSPVHTLQAESSFKTQVLPCYFPRPSITFRINPSWGFRFSGETKQKKKTTVRKYVKYISE